MKVISLSPNSAPFGYSRSARGFPPHCHSRTQANIQHVASEVSASTTRVASGKSERAKPRNFLLNKWGRSSSHSLHSHSIGQHLVTLSHSASGKTWDLISNEAAMCPAQLYYHGRRRKRVDGWSATISTFCIKYLKIWRPILGMECCLASGLNIQGMGSTKVFWNKLLLEGQYIINKVQVFLCFFKIFKFDIKPREPPTQRITSKMISYFTLHQLLLNYSWCGDKGRNFVLLRNRVISHAAEKQCSWNVLILSGK